MLETIGKFLGSLILNLIMLLQMWLIGFIPITGFLFVGLLFAWRCAPAPILPVHFFSIVPSILGVVLLIWGAFWDKRVPSGEIWQGRTLGILCWLAVLAAIVILIVFRKHWLFFLLVLLNQLWFVYLCFAVSAMCISDTWL